MFKRNKKKLKSNAIFSNNKENIVSDYSICCKVLYQDRWFELTEAELSKDKFYNKLIDHLYKRKLIVIKDLIRYKILNKVFIVYGILHTRFLLELLVQKLFLFTRYLLLAKTTLSDNNFEIKGTLVLRYDFETMKLNLK